MMAMAATATPKRAVVEFFMSFLSFVDRTLRPRPRRCGGFASLVSVGVDVARHSVIRNGMRGSIILATSLIAAASCANSSEGTPASMMVTPSVATTFVTTSTATTTASTTNPTSVPVLVESTVLANFAEPEAIDGWFVQNDTVMGGVSSSTVKWDDGDLVFSGVLSTENNGGFASTRGPILEAITEPVFDAISVESQGDGRTYLLQVRTDTDSYIQRFTPQSTMANSTLALDDFVATDWRLEPLANRPPLTSNAIRQLAIYLLDKQVGEFVLRVGSLALVSS